MVSLTKKIETRRRNKVAKQGRRRKRLLRNKGSTPSFPIHREEAAPSAAPAPAEAKASAPAAGEAGPAAIARIQLRSVRAGAPPAGAVVEKVEKTGRTEPRSL